MPFVAVRAAKKMTHGLKRVVSLLPLSLPLLLCACAQGSQLDTALAENRQLRDQNQQLQQQAAADKAHISRLQEAVKYTVNSDLLFPSGGWQMSAAGENVIAKMAKILAPDLQDKLLVNGYTDDAPVGQALRQRGITSNQMLSQKRAETVMAYMISQGVKPDLVTAQGFGEADPVASNSTAQGRAQNRRVEVTLAGSGS
jgi:chemotaxis protein MotB